MYKKISMNVCIYKEDMLTSTNLCLLSCKKHQKKNVRKKSKKTLSDTYKEDMLISTDQCLLSCQKKKKSQKKDTKR